MILTAQHAEAEGWERQARQAVSKVTVSLGHLVRPYLKIKSKKRPRGKTSIPSTTKEGEGGVEERNEET